MSLIDDALRRARESASRGDPSSRTKGYPWIPANMPDRAGARRAAWAGLAGGVLVALAAAAAAYWLWLKPAAPSPATAKPAPSPVRRAAAPLPTVVVAPPDISKPPGSAGAPRPRRSDATAAEGSGPAAVSPAAPPLPAAAAAPAPPAPERRAEPPASTSSESLSLDGIVYSESHPVAMINGTLVPVGGVVGVYVVEQIEPDRVVLRGPGGLRTLRLK
jgi:hypothetical protein